MGKIPCFFPVLQGKLGSSTIKIRCPTILKGTSYEVPFLLPSNLFFRREFARL